MAKKRSLSPGDGGMTYTRPVVFPEEPLAYYNDKPEMDDMLMQLCVEMRDMACAKVGLWFIMSHRFKREKQQRNIRKSGYCTAKAETENVLQNVEQIYRRGRRFRRCMTKAA